MGGDERKEDEGDEDEMAATATLRETARTTRQ